MTTKEYLNQISRLDRMIRNKFTEICQLRELSCSISAVQTTEERVKSTPNFDKIGTAYIKIEDMERELDEVIDLYTDKRNAIMGQIDSIEDENYYNILFSRYIERKTFEAIAASMNYSFRNTTRLHGKALQAFEKKYGDSYLKL